MCGECLKSSSLDQVSAVGDAMDQVISIYRVLTFLHLTHAEILIFGTGKTVLPVPQHVKRYLNKLGIQIEAHNSVSHSSPFAAPAPPVLTSYALALAKCLLDVQYACRGGTNGSCRNPSRPAQAHGAHSSDRECRRVCIVLQGNCAEYNRMSR